MILQALVLAFAESCSRSFCRVIKLLKPLSSVLVGIRLFAHEMKMEIFFLRVGPSFESESGPRKWNFFYDIFFQVAVTVKRKTTFLWLTSLIQRRGGIQIYRQIIETILRFWACGDSPLCPQRGVGWAGGTKVPKIAHHASTITERFIRTWSSPFAAYSTKNPRAWLQLLSKLRISNIGHGREFFRDSAFRPLLSPSWFFVPDFSGINEEQERKRKGRRVRRKYLFFSSSFILCYVLTLLCCCTFETFSFRREGIQSMERNILHNLARRERKKEEKDLSSATPWIIFVAAAIDTFMTPRL